MFDVDCPTTPDGDSIKQPVRPPSVARRIANSRIASNSKLAPRGIRSNNSYDRHHDGHVGLEPEEMTMDNTNNINNNNNNNNTASAAANNGGPYRAAPPPIHRTPPSNNPFDDDSVIITARRQRTHSDSWWKEDIVQERMDKTDLLEGYYGLSRKGECCKGSLSMDLWMIYTLDDY